uniref:Nucleolar pre-ribosomal-associated protein 1 N-terminal domain-containing protein n=1 Tax=Davidia involucrata TaxID=16924 RepID=A0A5B6YI04_DAVIN
MEGDNDSEFEGEEIPKFVVKVSHEAKLKELLRNITSIELKLCSDASKEFIKLLRGDAGGKLLREYIQTSSKCLELLQAWKLRQGKPGLSFILSLFSAILSHTDGKYKPNNIEGNAISQALDKFARMIIEEKLGDLYKELNSKEAKRQNAAFLLLTSIVRRASGLASEVAKSFDFKLPIFPNLAEYKRKQFEMKRKHSTRRSFIGFAMSFLEVGKPGLLRWVLQQKEMYSGILRGLGNDDDETVVYVLSTLRDRVLTPESLVPPGLRSVLFGSVTLDQLINISGRENGGLAAETAHSVLVMVCTDPSNGLMPDLKRHPNPLRGNLKRLLDLMKKLKATDIDYHRDLLLAIVKERPSFGSAYMDEFPYNLEDHASPTWFAAVYLASNLVSSVGTGLSFGFLDSQPQNPLSFSNLDVQSIIKCIGPRPFTRLVINKGLLHSDSLVKHGTLRLVLEVLKLLDAFIGAINSRSSLIPMASLQQEIQNEVRILLPDPQVLFSLLSSLNSHYKSPELGLKRAADSEILLEHYGNGVKKLKTHTVSEDMDILVSGISSSPSITLPGDSKGILDTHNVVELDNGNDHVEAITEIWGLDRSSMPGIALKDLETYFLSKLLDAIKIYHRTMPAVLEGSFDFFKVLPSNPLSLPTILQQSLLSLLIEHIGWSPNCQIPIRNPPLMFKHLHAFINLMMYSPIRDIKDQAHVLAEAAMLSTGAFDKNPWEIGAWFLFLPGYSTDNSFVEEQGVEVFQNLSPSVVSFLCDAVSTVGNNLFKYWDLLRSHIYQLNGDKDVSLDFSPLVICVLEKCLRLLSSESGTFTLPEKSMISLYVCNTIRYLLQTQVEVGLLSSLIDLLLSERLGDRCSLIDVYGDCCEWRPLKNLLLFSRSITNQKICSISSIDRKAVCADNSFVNTLGEIKRIMRSSRGGGLVGIIKAFSFSMMCTTPAEILQNFPSVISISKNFLGVPLSFLSAILYSEQSFLGDVAQLWPDMFFNGLKMVVDMIHGEGRNDDACRKPFQFSSQEEVIPDIDIDSIESASVAFSLFLKQVPFSVLFPASVSIGGHLLEHSKLQALLLAKLSESTTDDFIPSFRLVLFWIYQIQSSYRIKPSGEMEHLYEICFILIEHMLAQLFFAKADSGHSTIIGAPLSTHHIQEVAKTIFCHPAVTASLECSLGCSEEFTNGIFENSLENFLHLSKHGVHKMDHHVLNLLMRTSNYLLAFSNYRKSMYEVDDSANERIVKKFNILVQRLFLIFRDKFDLCIKTKDLASLVPTLYALLTLIHFISPFELLELAHWIFCRIDLSDLTVGISSKNSAVSVGLCIAGGAFELLSAYLRQPCTERVSNNLFWGIEEKSLDVDLFERIYFQIFEIATRFELDVADLCLVQAVNVVATYKFMQHQFFAFSMFVSRVMIRTPIRVLSHCIHSISMTKAKLLFLLTEVSPLHLSVFGCILSDMMNKYMLLKDNVMEETCNHTLSDEDFMMLLPVALSYLNSSFMKYGEHFCKHLRSIPNFYMRIILDGFINWKSYVSGDIFQVEYSEPLPSSTEELLNLVNGSLLGKTIHMLQYCFSLNGDSIKLKKRLKLFDSVCLCNGEHDDLLDCDVNAIDAYSLQQSLNFVNRVVAKISLCRMLLFPMDNQIQSLRNKGDGDMKEMPLEVGSSREDWSRIRFVNTLVQTWQLIVKKFPLNSVDSGQVKGSNCFLFKFLEVFILRNIFELTMKMSNGLIQLQSLPFLERLARSSFLHRFEDPTTLKFLRNILTSLSGGKFSCILFLQLLVAHSQFAPSIHSVSKSSGCSEVGVIFRPMFSILRSLIIPCTDRNALDGKDNPQTSERYMKQLEVIKLLRVLFYFKANQSDIDSEKDFGINSRELVFLLLSSYGATLSEIDLEMYNLMHEIESTDESNSGNIAEMDYLWGCAALRIRKEREQEQALSTDNMIDNKAVEECRKNQFRENLPIDPKLCAATVLYFPYDRTVSDGTLCLNKLQQDNSKDMLEKHFTNVEKPQVYDPVFILRFSIHCLSMGYIEPLEFTSLGLLAVAFVSISSRDNEMRKLGYEVLGRFKTALEKCQRRKDVMRLRLLLTYLQNGIEEPWQRIPSITAVFVAEASLLLLDPSHDHYSTISKFLMCSPGVNLKCVPLFHNFFWSSSVNFKTDRLWTLRLLYAGLNLEDDAQIYTRNSILETLLSFYASSLSDNASKELILQIVKKSMKLHKMARYLVEHCGLIPWLSSVVSFFCGKQCQDQRSSSLIQLNAVLQVVSDVISSRNTIEWLQKYALEQLSELSSHLYKLLVGDVKLMKEHGPLASSILQILTSTLKISQKRKIFQPHFTLSFEGLFHIYRAVDVYGNARHSPVAEFGLRTVLMSNPPVAIFHTDSEKLCKFVMWAISTALRSDCTCDHFTMFSEEGQSEDSLISKLLRWLTASVVLGRLSWKSNDLDSNHISERSNPKTLQSLFEHIEKQCMKNNKSDFGCEEILATAIFYLQQLLGMNCSVVPSVVSALCLLLFSDASHLAGSEFLLGHECPMASLWARIHCPAEASPTWRWSFYQPWKDLTADLTNSEKMDEVHACQTLLVIIANVLGKNSSDFQVLSHQDLEKCGVFKWERSILETE